MTKPNRSHNLRVGDRLPFPADYPRRDDGTPRGTSCHSETRDGLPWVDMLSVCQTPTSGQSHCSVCHYTFSTVGQFDAHRLWGWCLKPGALGLSRSTRWPWLWGTSQGLAAREAAGVRLHGPHPAED